jgi:hypothetical protein
VIRLAAAQSGTDAPAVACRAECGACCIAPSISSPLPGLPGGKPAGVPCPHLDPARRCRLFGDPRRPTVCGSLQPSVEMCGSSAEEALRGLLALEIATAPAAAHLPGALGARAE